MAKEEVMFAPSTALRAALAASFALVLTTTFGTPGAAAKDPFGGKFNHYQCYRIVDGGSGLKADVTLRDQFREDAAAILKPVMLCNPVDKNGEGIPNEEVHLVCYEIKVENPDDKTVYGVAIQNQLEEAKYYLKGPEMLCVPSTKKRFN
jgi:hypothetical protein